MALVLSGVIKSTTYYGNYPEKMSAYHLETLVEFLSIELVPERPFMQVLPFKEFCIAMHFESAIRSIGQDWLTNLIE
ncbi:hypothetical protein GC101_17270 [Paenibacillus sp. LMG 31459]|uniref:Uncharacterized protein n=1 Tax=Paenibacillus phytohabitans TaxID=2654978 RepID=A0ABX1YI38_9BACL|nr:hypothetical protein [Paenibacillus phytohabitans]NOU80617.1 hypothetical protein [Paenibacillus phytohabitans]